MKQNMMQQAVNDAARPERLVWYRDLVEGMTGCAPVLGQTTVPVLIDGMYWQVVQVVASIPAFVSSAGLSYDAVRRRGETEEEALRALCEYVHALIWAEPEVFALSVWVEPVWQVAGVA
jgi:hypothetical protein